jgi:hypothetical protein
MSFSSVQNDIAIFTVIHDLIFRGELYYPNEVAGDSELEHTPENSSENKQRDIELEYVDYEKLRENFECSICLDIIKGNVAVLNKCRHKYCSSCIYKLISERNNVQTCCPQCRDPIEFSDITISGQDTKLLESSIVICKNVECKEKMCRENYYKHFYTCGYKKTQCPDCKTLVYSNRDTHVCLNSSIKCNNCSEVVKAFDMEKHECPNELVSCVNLRCGHSYKRCEAELHLSECKYSSLFCNMCGKMISKVDMQAHKESECRGRNVSCDSCKEVINFSNYEDHISHVCPMALIPCIHCHVSYFRKQIKSHANNCGYRPRICDYCKMRVEVRLYESHLKVCDRVPTFDCPDCKKKVPERHECGSKIIYCEDCGHEIKMSEKISHDSVCEEKLIFCEYSRVGCHYHNKRRFMKDHLVSNVERHEKMKNSSPSEVRSRSFIPRVSIEEDIIARIVDRQTRR